MSSQKPNDPSWFTVRCILHDRDRDAYEERITLWRADGFDAAIARAEHEVREYSRDSETTEYTGLAQAYQLSAPPVDGAEVFSLIRDSQLAPHDYLNKFFDTGSERQQNT